jgi:hypothetical protein
MFINGKPSLRLESVKWKVDTELLNPYLDGEMYTSFDFPKVRYSKSLQLCFRRSL